jgi:kinesin family protein 2/24
VSRSGLSSQANLLVVRISSLIILGEIDCVSCSNPSLIVHECKYKVDAITKYIENSEFLFDNSFGHDETNEDLYMFSIKPIIDLVFNQGIVTVFAYGQTGSGKTYTMNALQEFAIKDLFDKGVDYFQNHSRNFTVTIAMYEVYGGKIYDLLNNHEVLKILEDKNNKIQVAGLKEQFV